MVEANDEVQWKHLELVIGSPSILYQPVRCLVSLEVAGGGKHRLQDSDELRLKDRSFRMKPCQQLDKGRNQRRLE